MCLAFEICTDISEKCLKKSDNIIKLIINKNKKKIYIYFQPIINPCAYFEPKEKVRQCLVFGEKKGGKLKHFRESNETIGQANINISNSD